MALDCIGGWGLGCQGVGVSEFRGVSGVQKLRGSGFGGIGVVGSCGGCALGLD